jgi:hypothetical protein
MPMLASKIVSPLVSSGQVSGTIFVVTVLVVGVGNSSMEEHYKSDVGVYRAGRVSSQVVGGRAQEPRRLQQFTHQLRPLT